MTDPTAITLFILWIGILCVMGVKTPQELDDEE